MNSRGVETAGVGLDPSADLDEGDPSRRPAARRRKAPAWPVSLRDRYGSITLAEVLRFHLIRWHTRRNVRRYRKRQGKQATWARMIRPNHPRIRARRGRLRESHLLHPGKSFVVKQGVRGLE